MREREGRGPILVVRCEAIYKKKVVKGCKGFVNLLVTTLSNPAMSAPVNILAMNEIVRKV